jgi:NAD(P)-dependent dehydrogenase (short-subunit alcohol dehydrogenase family)
VALRQETPMNRRSTPDEQAAVIAFLACADASYMTGQILSVAGGATVTG